MAGEIPAADLKNVRPIDLQSLYVTGCSAVLAGNDFIVTFTRSVPATADNLPPSAEGIPTLIMNQPLVAVSLSPGSMKDVYLAFKDQLERYEKEYGVVETDYSRRITAKK